MYSAPNYTQIPNAIIDEFMASATPAQFKCVMLILRQTLGWHRQSAEISINDFIKKTGLAKSGVLKSLGELEELGHIIVERRGNNQKNVYAPNIDWNGNNSKKDKVVHSVDQGSTLSGLGVVHSVDPSTESLKKRERKEKETTTTPEAAPSPEQNSSSFFSQEKQELVKDLPINQQTKMNLMRFKIETIKAAIKNTSTASYDDYGAYIYNQAKNIEAGNYKERKHSEDYAESHKKRCIEEFGDRLTLPIRGGEKLKVTPYNKNLELVVGAHAKIFDYASASFLHEVDKYFEKCGAAFRFNACGVTPQ